MLYSLLIAAAVLIVILFRTILKPGERCPECGQKREGDAPICACGWVFEYPDSDDPLEYGPQDDDGPDSGYQPKG